jgi:hypothetical protein
MCLLAVIAAGACTSESDKFDQAKSRLNSASTQLFVAQYLYGNQIGPNADVPAGLSTARDTYQQAQSDVKAFESDSSLTTAQRACARDLVEAGDYNTVTALTLTSAFAACDSGNEVVLPPGPIQTLAPYAMSSSAPQSFPSGTVVLVAESGTPRLEIAVFGVSFSPSYGSGDAAQFPKTAGDIFTSVRVTYDAIWDGATYNRYDWRLRVDGTPSGDPVLPLHGPTPMLDAGTLIAGRVVSGYIVYEVPPTGRISMVYYCYHDLSQSFEVVLRDH